MSGHSKFANIKHKKERNDAAKGKIFTIIGREIAIAVKEGGADPNNNSKLRDVIAKAKASNMPNDTIERGIKKAAGNQDSVNYEQVTYEGYGPSGIAIIVDALTDNRNRTSADVRAAFSKGQGNVGTPGCVSFMFDKKGQIIIDKEECDLDADDMMMEALDAGADDFQDEEDSYVIMTDPDAFSEVRDRIRYRVINYEMNKEFLQDIPFRRVLDLAVVLYYTVDLRLSETATIFVRCDTVRRWGVSEEDLFSLAESATPVADPPCVCPLTKLLVELGLEEEIWDEPGDVPLWIITNDRRTFGSACMFYPKVLAETAAFIGADLFILPSSIHEVLAMPNNGTLSREELELMVRQINVTQVKRTEVLSDHVYSYRRGERALTLL